MSLVRIRLKLELDVEVDPAEFINLADNPDWRPDDLVAVMMNDFQADPIAFVENYVTEPDDVPLDDGVLHISFVEYLKREKAKL